MDSFTDFKFAPGRDGVWDLVVDEANRDLAMTDGMETAVLFSLFSDRRAAPDEVANPWRRRGWIGNLVPDVPGDNFGSGIWLYEQRRGTSDVLSSLRLEAISSLSWMVPSIASSVDASFAYEPKTRRFSVLCSVTTPGGSSSSHAFDLWRKTAPTTISNT